MYERFTDRARKVMQLANQEAQRFNHEFIRTEHILLGLVKEGSGVAANVLRNLDIDLRKIRLEVERLVPHAPSQKPVPGRLALTPRTTRALEYSIEEARNLNHNYVGTEHLLLGLLREQEGVAAQVLMNLGLKLEDVRGEILGLLGHNLPSVSPDQEPEVTFIPKSLNPLLAEAYPVSELEPADLTPSPHLTTEQIQIVQERVRHLTEQKETAVAEQDFVRAAQCRDEAEALDRLLAWYTWFRAQS